ncbi:MAG TPA: DUF4082 domain-containing protein [Candidatus Saccharimonadia bacterium]|nr:DUF4082 domain-containing protein [Candidatus Saccharimonadia bacterium]
MLVLALGTLGLSIPAAHAATTETIYTAANVPTTAGYLPDTAAVEVGAKVVPATTGTFDGGHFYHLADATGTYYVHLWTSSGTLLATGSVTGLASTGWQTVNFTTPGGALAPVNVTAGTTYVVSYLAPHGQYAYDGPSNPGNLNSAKTSAAGDLTEPASGTVGGNGLYKYPTVSGATSAFPANTTSGSNYWVDPVYTPGASAPPPPPPSGTHVHADAWLPTTPNVHDASAVATGMKFTSSTSGYITGLRFYKGAGNTGVHIGSLWATNVQHSLLASGTYVETASGWQDLVLTNPVPIEAGVTYIVSNWSAGGNYAYAADLGSGMSNPPLSAPAGNNGVYTYAAAATVPLKGTADGDYGVDVTFSTTGTQSTTQPAPRTGTVGAGSVLVLTDPTNAWTDDVCDALLPTQGYTCTRTDAANLTTASVLTPYHTVVLGDGVLLTSAQITLVNNWLTGTSGNHFIAMRPKENLNTLLGLGPRTGILPDAYVGIDTTQAPGLGNDPQPLQYHGVADKHALLSGTRAVATIWSDASTPTTFPAVTARPVGTGASLASAWLFDLSKSVAYTRFGNPALVGATGVSQLNTATVVPRLVDRFQDYLNPNKVAVPQADLQLRLLGNQIQQTGKFPAPSKWLFPSYPGTTGHAGGRIDAAVILTADNHSGGPIRYNDLVANHSPAGCTVAAWTCARDTTYLYPNTSITDAALKTATDNGAEIGPHIATSSGNCAQATSLADATSLVTATMAGLTAQYPLTTGAHPPTSTRTHCYAWPGTDSYNTAAQAERASGLTADTSTSCWPAEYIPTTGPCNLGSSAIPMQYTDANGVLSGVNQFLTQVTDENTGQIDKLDDLVANATGPLGFRGYFTALAHEDGWPESTTLYNNVWATAAAADIPVISAAQAQAFMTARAATGVANPTYAASTISFAVANSATNLLMTLPVKYGTKTLTGIKRGTTTLPFSVQTIDGTSVALVAPGTGTITATYA